MLRVRGRMERYTVTIEFGGPIEEVSVGAFAATLFGYATVAQEAAKLVNPSATVDVNVRAVRPGCVSADLAVVTSLMDALRNIAGFIAPIAPDIVATVAAFYQFKRDVARGGGIKEIQNGNSGVTVVTNNGSPVTINQTTYNLYSSSPKASKAVSETFSQLDIDPAVESVSIGAGTVGSVRVSRDDFRNLATSHDAEAERMREVEEQDVSLSVLKPNFVMSADRKWGFVNGSGLAISASIADKEFLEALPSLSFTMGTVMVVNLKKTQAYDRRLNIFIDRADSYVITKVLDIIGPSITPEIPGFSDADVRGDEQSER